MKKKYNIGVFDSGVGGTTVLKQVIKLLPNENIIYYADSLNSPYGEKSKEEIVAISKNIVDFFIANDCKLIIIACNTATAGALDYLEKNYSIPIIGVIKNGAISSIKTTKNNKIGILATSFTVKSKAYLNIIKKYSENIHISQQECPEFCPMIENGWSSFENRYELLKKYITNLDKDIDTLILGCTHYPLIKKDIEIFFKGNIIDPAFETAIEVEKTLNNLNLKNSTNLRGNIKFYVSGNLEKFKNIAESFLGFNIENIEKI